MWFKSSTLHGIELCPMPFVHKIFIDAATLAYVLWTQFRIENYIRIFEYSVYNFLQDKR